MRILLENSYRTGTRETYMADSANILVLYHSSYGHVETLAYAVVTGARAVEGAQVAVRRVPELIPEETMQAAGIEPVAED